MGVLTDFVIADPTDAPRVGASLCPSQEFSGLDAKGIDQVKLSLLQSLLTGTSVDPDFMMGDAILFMGSEDGPWVQIVPATLVRRLATLEPPQLSRVAAQWAATEEFSPKYEHWPPQAVEQFLQAFAALCERAVAANKAVLMWMCL